MLQAVFGKPFIPTPHLNEILQSYSVYAANLFSFVVLPSSTHHTDAKPTFSRPGQCRWLALSYSSRR